MNKTINNLIVIGCGPHFWERYYCILEKIHEAGKLCIGLVIDLLIEKEKIQERFSKGKMQPERYLFLEEKYRNTVNIDYIEVIVKSQINLNIIDGVMICTEPKVHKYYAIWAIQNNLHVFVDKPLSAFLSYEQMDCLLTDYIEIIKFYEKSKVNFVMSCERRGHQGYKYIKEYIANIINKTNVPITYLDIHFAGGKWIMPDEYFYLENHPFKYGYGVLLHSGYHYIDLLMTFLSLNNSVIPMSLDDIDLYSLSTNPYNFFNIINNNIYLNLLKTNRFSDYFTSEAINKMKYFGETDLMVMGRFKNGHNVITNFNMKLIETSVSKRDSHLPPKDTYLLIGKMRQENLIIHIGHLCSIHIRSNPYSKISVDKNDIEDFSIDILNNAELLGNEPLIQITRIDLSKMFPALRETDRMNIKARQWQLTDFLNGGDGNSSLFSHGQSIKLLDMIYRQIQIGLTH